MVKDGHSEAVAESHILKNAALIPVGLQVVALYLGVVAGHACLAGAGHHGVAVHGVEGVQQVCWHCQVASLYHLPIMHHTLSPTPSDVLSEVGIGIDSVLGHIQGLTAWSFKHCRQDQECITPPKVPPCEILAQLLAPEEFLDATSMHAKCSKQNSHK